MYPDKNLIEKLTGIKIITYDTVSSTNDIAKEIVQSGDFSPCAVIAKTQTNGHGRGDRRFFSYNGGIYLSMIIPLRDVFSPAELLTSACAAAVCRAIRTATAVQGEVKWVNDIYVRSRKVCGILALHGGGAYIVGVGINVEKVSFPSDIRTTAAALDVKCDQSILCAEVINQIRSALGENPQNIINYCTEHSYTLGKNVTYIKNGTIYHGKAEKLLPHGELLVRLEGGEEDILSSGEVSVKNA